MAETKECPESVIKAGAALVQLRHHLEKAERLFENALSALSATGPDLKAAGARGMQYGVALDHLHNARRGAGLVMAAHDHMSGVVKDCNMATPTDEQLVKFGVPLNWR